MILQKFKSFGFQVKTNAVPPLAIFLRIPIKITSQDEDLLASFVWHLASTISIDLRLQRQQYFDHLTNADG